MIINKLYAILILLILTVSFSAVAALPTENDCVLYFYGTNCNHCVAPGDMLHKLNLKYPSIHIKTYDVYSNPENKALLESYFQNYAIPKTSQSLPVILIGDTYFIGDQAISTLVENYILSGDHYECPQPISKQIVGVAGQGSPINNFETLSYGTIFKAAIKDSFSPFLMVMFLLLIALVGSLKDCEEIRRRSMYFLIGAFVTYILYTFAVLSGFSPDGAPKYFAKAAGLIAIFAGMYIIRNFVLGKKGLVAQLPKARKRHIEGKVGTTFLSDAGFLWLGLLTALMTIPTTSAILPALRNLYLEPTWTSTLVPMLLFYLIILAIPMMILALGVYLTRWYFDYTGVVRGGGSERRIEIWQRHHLKLFRLFMSLLAIIIGMYVLFAHI